MKIETTQEKLAKALNIVSRVAIGSRNTLPILNNVLIKVIKKKVSLTTTNLDMAVVDYLPVSKAEDGEITVPARLLAEFISNLPKGELVKISSKDTKVKIEAGKYSSVMNGSLSDDFPELPDINEKEAVKFKVSADDFKNSLNQVIIASSNDLTRPALTGVFFNSNDGKLFVAATDGYRLAEKKLVDKISDEVAVIIPTPSLQEVLRCIGEETEEIEVLLDESQARFRLGETEITSKLIDGSFPNYRQLIPKENSSVVVLNKEELMRVTKLAALFAKEVGGSIVCEAKADKKVFSVASIANEYGENDSEIEAEIEKDDKVTLNSRFLIDALNSLSENTVKFGFSGALSPVVIRNNKKQDYTHIIMPLKG